MAELERIERHLAKGLVREYVLRRCSKLILEELCHRRNLIVLATGKRPSNRAVKNDYIRALLEYTRGKGATAKDYYPVLTGTEQGTEQGINMNDLEMEVSTTEAERGDMEMEVNGAGAEENGMETEVDKANDEVNGGGTGITGNQDPLYIRHNRDGNAELVRIRVFRGAKDWEPIDEMELRLESCGGLNLTLLQEKLGGRVHVISPRTYRPFYEYTKGFLDREDLQELLQDSNLRVIVSK